MIFIYYHIYSYTHMYLLTVWGYLFYNYWHNGSPNSYSQKQNWRKYNTNKKASHGVFRVIALLELILTGCYFYSMCIMPVSAFPNSPIRYLQHNMSLFVARLNVVRNLCKVFFLLFYLLKSQMRDESKSVLSDVEYRSR